LNQRCPPELVPILTHSGNGGGGGCCCGGGGGSDSRALQLSGGGGVAAVAVVASLARHHVGLVEVLAPQKFHLAAVLVTHQHAALPPGAYTRPLLSST